MQAGFTVAQFNRITNHNGKKTLTRCLALVLGISGSGSDENPDVNLIVFNQAKANALGGPDWHNAFDRLSVKHQDHADVTDGKETMFYSDVLTLYSEEDVRLHEDVLAPEQVTPPTAPSAADLDAVAKEQEVAKATAGESVSTPPASTSESSPTGTSNSSSPTSTASADTPSPASVSQSEPSGEAGSPVSSASGTDASDSTLGANTDSSNASPSGTSDVAQEEAASSTPSPEPLNEQSATAGS